jgi:ribosomal protein S21
MTNALTHPEPGEDIEAILRRFKNAMRRNGGLNDLRKHEAFESKSQRRKNKRSRAQARRISGQSKVKSRPGPETCAQKVEGFSLFG